MKIDLACFLQARHGEMRLSRIQTPMKAIDSEISWLMMFAMFIPVFIGCTHSHVPTDFSRFDAISREANRPDTLDTLLSSQPDGNAPRNAETLLHNLEVRLKTLKAKNLLLAISLSDDWNGKSMDSNDDWLAEEVEAQAKRVAREAFYDVLSDTVNKVPFIHRIRDHSRSLREAEIRIQDGQLTFRGPSLDPAAAIEGAGRDAGSGWDFRSQLKLNGGSDLGLSWRTTFGPLDYQMTYFPANNDFLGMNLKNRINDWTSIDLSYRMGSDALSAIATIHVAMP